MYNLHFYRRGNWGSEAWSHLPNAALLSGRLGWIWIQVCLVLLKLLPLTFNHPDSYPGWRSVDWMYEPGRGKADQALKGYISYRNHTCCISDGTCCIHEKKKFLKGRKYSKMKEVHSKPWKSWDSLSSQSLRSKTEP